MFYIDDFDVKPKSKGIGSQMLEFLASLAKKGSIQHIKVYIPENNTKAL